MAFMAYLFDKRTKTEKEIIYISELKNRLSGVNANFYELHCPCGCGKNVSVRHGDINQPHFWVGKDGYCKNMQGKNRRETELHLMAKKIILDSVRNRCSLDIVIPENLVGGELEQTIGDTQFRCDVKALSDKGESIFFEVEVTHANEERKTEYLTSLGIKSIQIDLSDEDFRKEFDKIADIQNTEMMECLLRRKIFDGDIVNEISGYSKHHNISRIIPMRMSNHAHIFYDQSSGSKIYVRWDGIENIDSAVSLVRNALEKDWIGFVKNFSSGKTKGICVHDSFIQKIIFNQVSLSMIRAS